VIDGRTQEALNKHANAEFYSSYLYLSMSAYFQSINLIGFAHWMRVQAREELAHAMKFYDHVIERGGRVSLQAVAAPTAQWDSPLAAFEDAHRHEQKVTGLINQLVDEAVQTRDHATNAFLQWFVSEQVEEEASVDAIVQKLKLVGGAPGGLFMIDHHLGERASG
jgi:ferritin